MKKGFAAQNQLYANIAGMLRDQPEAACDVKKLQAPTYQADLTAIQHSFMSAVQAVKKEVGNDLSANRELTSQAVKKIYAELTKGQKKPNRKITAEQIGEAVAQSVSHLPGIDTEAIKQMFLAMIAIPSMLRGVFQQRYRSEYQAVFDTDLCIHHGVLEYPKRSDCL